VDSSPPDLREVLARAGVDTVVIGANAANLYRLDVRLTVDVVLLALTLDGAAEALREVGCEVRVVSDDGRPYLITARRGSEVVDLLLAETEYQRRAFDRATDGALRVEDVIVHKVIAGRAQDLDDIASIMATGLPFDRAYIVEHAATWGVTERWDAFG
jgi:hypothetical protein